VATLRVALASGGKDSVYAMLRAWPVDLALVLVYEFPRPSPHLVNLGKTVETLLMTGVPVVVVRLTRGREREGTVAALRMVGATEVVAGDVYVEEHLRYLESVAAEAGASLLEPLWGEDPEELLHREVEDGVETLVVGCTTQLAPWLGRVLDKRSVHDFSKYCRGVGMDPLGEHGEYHTLVLSSPLHRSRLTYRVVGNEVYGEYLILRVA
jgi:uncharacterized protein (TIGR00290 family)